MVGSVVGSVVEAMARGVVAAMVGGMVDAMVGGMVDAIVSLARCCFSPAAWTPVSIVRLLL